MATALATSAARIGLLELKPTSMTLLELARIAVRRSSNAAITRSDGWPALARSTRYAGGCNAHREPRDRPYARSPQPDGVDAAAPGEGKTKMRPRAPIGLSRRHEPALPPGERGVLGREESALRLMHGKLTLRQGKTAAGLRAPSSPRGPRPRGPALSLFARCGQCGPCHRP